MTPDTTTPYATYCTDPRPDLVEDSALWSALLTLVRIHPALLGSLHAARCQGTRIRWQEPPGRWTLTPQCDADNWPDLATYHAFRDQYFKPSAATLAAALNKLYFAHPEWVPRQEV